MSGELTTPVYRSADPVAFASALFRRAGLDPLGVAPPAPAG